MNYGVAVTMYLFTKRVLDKLSFSLFDYQPSRLCLTYFLILESLTVCINTILEKSSAMKFFNFVFRLNRKKTLHHICLNVRKNIPVTLVTFHFQRLSNTSNPITCCLKLSYKQINTIFSYSKFD